MTCFPLKPRPPGLIQKVSETGDAACCCTAPARTATTTRIKATSLICKQRALPSFVCKTPRTATPNEVTPWA